MGHPDPDPYFKNRMHGSGSKKWPDPQHCCTLLSRHIGSASPSTIMVMIKNYDLFHTYYTFIFFLLFIFRRCVTRCVDPLERFSNRLPRNGATHLHRSPGCIRHGRYSGVQYCPRHGQYTSVQFSPRHGRYASVPFSPRHRRYFEVQSTLDMEDSQKSTPR